MVGNICIVAKSPLGNEYFTLALRTALATQIGGFDTKLVFMGQGLYGLTGKLPGYLAKALDTFRENEGQLCCVEDDLKQRRIDQQELNLHMEQILDSDDLAEILGESDTVNVY